MRSASVNKVYKNILFYVSNKNTGCRFRLNFKKQNITKCKKIEGGKAVKKISFVFASFDHKFFFIKIYRLDPIPPPIIFIWIPCSEAEIKYIQKS